VPGAGAAGFPASGLTMRGRPGHSAASLSIGIFAAVVAVSDCAVAGQWYFRGRPGSILFVVSAGILAVVTVLLTVLLVLARLGVRRQQYRISTEGIEVPWRGRRHNELLAWSEITAIERHYHHGSGERGMGVAIFVVDPARLHRVGHEGATPAHRADDNRSRFGTPIYVELTDIPGGTLRFLAAVQHYGVGQLRDDLALR
jgi:hypothetical protein